MELKARVIGIGAFLLVPALIGAPAQSQETPRMGGVLKAAMIGEPPSLDMQWTTAVITQEITCHVYEGALHVRRGTSRRSRCWPSATR